MKNLLIILSIIVVVSCVPRSDGNNSIEALEPEKTLEVIESFHPESMTVSRFDTLLENENIEVTIISRSLDSDVVEEYRDEETKHIYYFRNYEYSLIIKQHRETILDTTVVKGCFVELCSQEFLDIAVFGDYWFDEYEKERIKFQGSITKPDTDWSCIFHHYYDLNKGKLVLEPYTEEEI